MKSLYTMVGMQFRQAQKLVASMPAGEPLKLKRDPQNEHDRWAIEVWAHGRHVAFIKATEVKGLAQTMDAKSQTEIDARLVFDGQWPHAEIDQ